LGNDDPAALAPDPGVELPSRRVVGGRSASAVRSAMPCQSAGSGTSRQRGPRPTAADHPGSVADGRARRRRCVAERVGEHVSCVLDSRPIGLLMPSTSVQTSPRGELVIRGARPEPDNHSRGSPSARRVNVTTVDELAVGHSGWPARSESTTQHLTLKTTSQPALEKLGSS
jgi:hypothetical protein